MRRDIAMTKHRVFTGLLLSLLLVGATATLAPAQNATFSINWDDITLGDALRMLQGQFGIQYILSGDAGSQRVTIHRDNVTLQDVVGDLATAAGVRVLVDPNGVYVFQPGTSEGAEVYAQYPASPFAANPYGAGAPLPTRPGEATVQAQVSGTGYPTTAGQPGATGYGQQGLVTASGRVIDPADLTLRILELNYLNPAFIASMFGGSVYEDTGTSSNSGSSNYGGSSTGGNYGGGSSGGNYGGNNRGSSGGNYGGNNRGSSGGNYSGGSSGNSGPSSSYGGRTVGQ